MPFATVPVLDNRAILPGVQLITVPWAQAPEPGQFFMLRREGGAALLPRAISVCDWQDGVLTFCSQTVGKGTAELVGLKPGDLLHLTGPLGNGFPLGSFSGSIALVGGGVGTAPMLYTARILSREARAAKGFFGFRDEPFLTEALTPFLENLSLATESGRYGHKGFVTALFQPEAFDYVLCCGPEPMMKAVTSLCAEAGTPVYVSLENKMACGLGGCLVCTCTDKLGHNRRTCKDGPVFRGEEINFDA